MCGGVGGYGCVGYTVNSDNFALLDFFSFLDKISMINYLTILIFALLAATDSIIGKVRELEKSRLNRFTALVVPFSAAYCPICALFSSM